ncbi:hypothetical protein DY000_02006499 [Brassica cretica]|uniref:Uncharacterized protein n=1 Tax=Brassica cretica TaxID=69181 RepID=A0ABQ7C3S2_BRACR|nr:hypothetical protein DY000_02006499 [Brassica cretica]
MTTVARPQRIKTGMRHKAGMGMRKLEEQSKSCFSRHGKKRKPGTWVITPTPAPSKPVSDFLQKYMPSSTGSNKETQLIFSPDPASLERSIRKEARSLSTDNNTSVLLNSAQPPSTQTPVPSTDTRSPLSTDNTHLPSNDIFHLTSFDIPSRTSIDTEPRGMVAPLILVRDNNGDLHDQEGHLRNAAVVKEEKLQEGDFEVESLMSFGESHWCRSAPDTEHRSTYTNPNRSTKIPAHRSTTPTESIASCNAVKNLTHEEFAAKHPHPPSPDNVRIDRHANSNIDRSTLRGQYRSTTFTAYRSTSPYYLPSADAEDRCCTT